MKNQDFQFPGGPNFLPYTTFLQDATLDYHDGLMGAGFTIEIPSAKNSCGCGDSFGM